MRLSLITIGFLFISAISSPASALTNTQIAEEITALFLAFKIVIHDAQPQINQLGVGDKGLNAKAVKAAAMLQYEKVNGRPFTFSTDPLLNQAQKNIIASANTIIDNIQPLINNPDIGFKGIITAIFTRKLATEFSQRSKIIRFKFTAPDHLLRSEKNRADTWESQTFQQHFLQSDWPENTPHAATIPAAGSPTDNEFRWMFPLYHQAGCLSCHGHPAGELDKVGFIKEGANLGDLAGALSIVITQSK